MRSKSEDFATLDFIRDGGETARYHTSPVLRRQNVGEHSFHVAMLAGWLTGYSNASILMAALVHDLPEHKVGDIPAPVKRELEGFREALLAKEAGLLFDAGLSFMLSPEEQRILDFADCADGALYCARERAMGNRLMTKIYDKYMEYLEDGNGSKEKRLIKYIKRQWRLASE